MSLKTFLTLTSEFSLNNPHKNCDDVLFEHATCDEGRILTVRRRQLADVPRQSKTVSRSYVRWVYKPSMCNLDEIKVEVNVWTEEGSKSSNFDRKKKAIKC
jgi:hypothetical protein